MTQISQQPATLNYNGKDYVIQELSPEAQSCLVYMQEIDFGLVAIGDIYP